jgi:hypothetical protein
MRYGPNLGDFTASLRSQNSGSAASPLPLGAGRTNRLTTDAAHRYQNVSLFVAILTFETLSFQFSIQMTRMMTIVFY